MDEREIGRLYREATRAPDGRDGCPSAEEFGRAATDDLSDAERASFAEHLARCATCSSEFLLLRPAREAVHALPAETTRPPRRFSTPARLLAAAAVLIASGLSILVTRHEGPTSRVAERGLVFSVPSVTPRDGAVLSSAPEELVIPVESGAESYRVIVYDAESAPIWESPRLRSNVVRLPADVRASLAAGHAYYWRFIVHRDVDSRQSPLLVFRLRP